MKKILLIFGLVLTAVACQPKTAEVITEVKEETPTNSPSAAVSEGESLYTNSCHACHKLFEPSEFSVEKWTSIVPPMTKKAKLQPEQGDKILAYVLWAKENQK